MRLIQVNEIMNFTISTNPNKKLHKDLYTQIDMLSDLINRKSFDLKKELHDYELLNFKVNSDVENELLTKGLYDPNIKTLKQTINDFQYFIDTLTELKTKIPVK